MYINVYMHVIIYIHARTHNTVEIITLQLPRAITIYHVYINQKYMYVHVYMHVHTHTYIHTHGSCKKHHLEHLSSSLAIAGSDNRRVHILKATLLEELVSRELSN